MERFFKVCRVFFVALSVIVSANTHAQDESDSIEVLLSDPAISLQEWVRIRGDYATSGVFDAPEAVNYIEASLNRASEDPSGLATMYLYRKLALAYTIGGGFEQGFAYAQKHMDLAREKGLPNELGKAMHGAMLNLYEQDRYQEVFEIYYHNKGWTLRMKDSSTFADIYYTMAITHDMLGDIDSAEVYYWKSHGYMGPSAIGSRADVLGALLSCLAENNRMEKADQVMVEIQGLIPQLQRDISKANNHFALGNYLAAKGDYSFAVDHLLKALSLAEPYTDPVFKVNCLQALANAYAEGGQYERAWTTHQHHTALNDSILSHERKMAILEFEQKYENEKLRSENLEIEKDKIRSSAERDMAVAESGRNRQMVIIILVAALAALLIMAIVWIVTLSNRKTAQLKAEVSQQRAEKELIESQLKALKSQMNPHFIFNSLNSIQDLILKQETEKSYDYIVMFADLVRSTLSYSNLEFIPITQELEFLDLYLSLEKLRFDKDFEVDISYSGEKSVEIPALLVQPFLENAILHGLLHKQGKKRLSVDFTFESNSLSCVIIDNGVGREMSREINARRVDKHESFSTKAIQERLEKYADKFDKPLAYLVEDLTDAHGPCGTKITLEIPFRPIY